MRVRVLERQALIRRIFILLFRKYRIFIIVKDNGIAWFVRIPEGVFEFVEETELDCVLTDRWRQRGAGRTG